MPPPSRLPPRDVLRFGSSRLASIALVIAVPAASAQRAPTLSAHFEGTFRAHYVAGRELAFSPNGLLLATSGADGAIHLWNTPTGRRVRTLAHPQGATSLAFSPDGQWIVTGGYDHTVRLWRVSDGTLARTLGGHTGTVWSVAFSPDGRTIASSGEDKVVRLWNAADGQPTRVLAGHRLNVWHVAFSPDGRRLVSGSFDHTLKVWNTRTGTLLQTIPAHRAAVVGVAISHDGRNVASGGDDATVHLWRLRNGHVSAEPRLTLTGGDHVYTVAFSGDDRWLASGGREFGSVGTFFKQIAGDQMTRGKGRSVRLWRVSDGALEQVLDTGSDVSSVAFSPDGRWLATSGEEGWITVWRLTTTP